MARALREALVYVESIVLVMHLAERLTRGAVEARGIEALLDQLAALPPMSRPAWVVLGRLTRHVVSALEEAADVHLVLAVELQDEVMSYVDAQASQKGSR